MIAHPSSGPLNIDRAQMANKKTQKKSGIKKNDGHTSRGKSLNSAFRGPMKIPKAPRVNLDQYAKDYAALLANPCNAPLVNSVFPGANGALVGRYEQDFVVGNEFPGTTTGAFVFLPGVNGAAVNRSLAAITTDTQPLTWNVLNPGPGGVFLQQQSAFRCISACVQVYYPGTELNRSGIVGLGYSTGGVVSRSLQTADGGQGLTFTVSALRASQIHVERTPANMVELIWKPGQQDMEWYAPQNQAQIISSATTAYAGRTALLVSYTGLPAGVGVRIRIVTAIEYIPGSSDGIITTGFQAPRSKNTINDVVKYLDQSGEWFLKTATKFGPYVSHAVGYVASLM